MREIRPTTRADLAEVDALLARSYPRLLKHDYPPSVLVTALPLIARAQPHLATSGAYFAVIESGRIVGVGGWSRDRRRRDLGHIRHVASDHRKVRTGIGRDLMHHILREARGAGMTAMECRATPTAVPFYATFGFREVGPLDVELQPGITFTSVRMAMDLADRHQPG